MFLFRLLLLISPFVLINQPKGNTLDICSKYNPDISINKKLFLENYKSGDLFYHCKVVDNGFRATPSALYQSSNAKQYLVCYQYEGGVEHAYDFFEFGYADKEIAKLNLCTTNEELFFTESGLKLGLAYSDVIKLKGIPRKSTKGINAVIEYKIISTSSIFFKKYNMPGYSMVIYFKNGFVNKVKFGFDYP